MYVLKKSTTWDGYLTSPVHTVSESFDEITEAAISESKDGVDIWTVFEALPSDGVAESGDDMAAPEHVHDGTALVWASSFVNGNSVVPPSIVGTLYDSLEERDAIYGVLLSEIEYALKEILREDDEDIDDVPIPEGSAITLLRLLVSLVSDRTPSGMKLADWAILTIAWIHELGMYTDTKLPLRAPAWWSSGLDLSAEVIGAKLESDQLVPYVEQVRFDAYRIAGKPYRAVMTLNSDDGGVYLLHAHALVNVKSEPIVVSADDLPKKVQQYIDDCKKGSYAPLLSANLSLTEDGEWQVSDWKIAE